MFFSNFRKGLQAESEEKQGISHSLFLLLILSGQRLQNNINYVSLISLFSLFATL